MPKEDYIDLMSQATAPWSAPDASLIDSPVWLEKWATASDIAKDNLTHGWIACWIESMSDLSSTQTHGYVRETWLKKREWFRTISAYIRSDVVAEMGLPAFSGALEKLFVKNTGQDPGVAALKTLWFGNEEQRLEALDSIPLNMTFMKTYGALVPALAWDAVKSPLATPYHRGIAGCISIDAGRGFVDTGNILKLDENDRMWMRMGRLADAYNVNKGCEEIGRQYFPVISAMPPADVALPIGRLLDAALRDDNVNTRTVYPRTAFGSICPDEKEYTALRIWIPQRKAVFDAMEAMGLPYQQALEHISREITNVLIDDISFPGNITPDSDLT